MPFYEYTCSHCGHHHEELQKVSDKPLRKCPECGRNTLSRIVSAPVFRLKGGGWYETDFKSDADRKRNLAGERDDGPKAESTESAEKKPETKPEAPAKEAKPAAEPAKASKSAGKRPSKPAPARAAPRKATAKPAKPARKARK